jgi:hypothetical protein
MHLKKLKNQSLSNVDDLEESNASSVKSPQLEKQLNNGAGEEKTFNFIVMIKKGNKPQFHNLEVPVASEFATKFKAREQVNKIKRRNLI